MKWIVNLIDLMWNVLAMMMVWAALDGYRTGVEFTILEDASLLSWPFWATVALVFLIGYVKRQVNKLDEDDLNG